MSAPVADLSAVAFHPFYGEEVPERALLGEVEFFGQWFHVQAIRVERAPAGEQRVYLLPGDTIDDPGDVWHDLDNMLDRLCAAEGVGAFQTVQLPGREGEWVLWIVPHAD